MTTTPDTISSVDKSKIITELTNAETDIKKAEGVVSSRKVIIVIGVILFVFWLASYFYASSDSSANPASVSFLGPILLSPAVILGILLIILGVTGLKMAQKQIKKLNERLKLLQSLLVESQSKEQ